MSLIATLMQPLRAKYTNDLDKNELRRSEYGAYDTFVRDTDSTQGIFSPQVKDLIKRSFGNSVVIPVLNAETVTIGNARTCTVAASENTSALVTLTFVTYAFGFTMTPAQHFNNDVGYQADFTRKFEKYLLTFAALLDTTAYTTANAARNQVWNADTLAQYPQVGNALQVAPSQADDAYNVFPAIMKSMDFSGPYNVIANTFHGPLVNRFINQGAGNSVNLAFQFMGFNYAYSNRVTNVAGAKSTVLLSPQGTYAVDNRNEPDAIANSRASDGTEWSEVQVPIINMNMGFKYNSRCADNSAIAGAATTGLTASLVESFQWSTDVVYATAYNSAPSTRSGPIVKAEFLAAEPTP